MRTRRLAGVALLAVAALGLTTPPAVGEGGFFDVVGGSWTAPPLMPGDSSAHTVTVTNKHPAAAELRLEALDVRSEENGCLEPEWNEGGDQSCAGTSGELAEWLEVTVTLAPTGDRPAEELWQGTLDDLEQGALLERAMPGGASWYVDLAAHLPDAAGNETMTDRVRYDLQWSLTGDDGRRDTDVLGVEQSAGGPPAGTGGIGLPGTGAGVGLMLPLIGVLMVLGGLGMVLAPHLRRRRLLPERSATTSPV